MSTPTAYLPPKRRSHWVNPENGRLTWAKREDETLTYTVDVTRRLVSGQSVSTATASEASGVTVGTINESSGVLTFQVSGTGSALITVVTTSPADTIEIPMEWVQIDRSSNVGVYR